MTDSYLQGNPVDRVKESGEDPESRHRLLSRENGGAEQRARSDANAANAGGIAPQRPDQPADSVRVGGHQLRVVRRRADPLVSGALDSDGGCVDCNDEELPRVPEGGVLRLGLGQKSHQVALPRRNAFLECYSVIS